jgi:cyclohexyl-isocyanide hydratase
MNRREFTGAVSVGIAAAGTPGTAVFAQGPGSQPDTAQRGEPRLVVAALVHDKMILLDLAGPLTVFNLLRAEVHLVGKSLTPVKTDVGIAIAPTTMLADCPANVDILFVPGGLEGTVAMMGDPEVVAFLADRGSRARYVTSVCTGSLLLGAAGLLRGYQATSHWYVRDLLGLMGASVRGDRVVVDRNRLTGGGVTAGVDFGLEIARLIRGEDTARMIQLVIEYDPKPPFDAGNPQQAGTVLTERVLRIRAPAIAAAREAALRAGQRFKP